jgi:hypothetical protein
VIVWLATDREKFLTINKKIAKKKSGPHFDEVHLKKTCSVAALVLVK